MYKLKCQKLVIGIRKFTVNGPLPDTCTSITGRGGYHLFYTDCATHRNKTGLYEGIDIRGEGGYVVAPPSIHPNGRTYEWECDPEDYSVTPADSTVCSFLLGNQTEKPRDKQLLPTSEIPEGARTNTLIRLVGSLRSKGLENETIMAAVRAENDLKCKPPFSDKELETTIFPALTRKWEVEAPYYANTRDVPSTGGVSSASTAKLSVIRLDSIEEKETEWIWTPYIPKGKITLLQGAPGCSKTTFLCRLIADLTTGRPFLGAEVFSNSTGNVFEPRKPVNVLFQITEDDFADTIVKRLRIAGADMSRVYNIDESKVPITFSDPRIKEAVKKWEIGVGCFDPIMSYMGKDVQLNVGNSVRAIMNHLISMGQELGCSFILTAHTSKQSSAEAINRLIGSIDFISSSRSVLTFGRDPNNESRKAFAHTKSNLAPLGSTVMYTIDYDDGLVKFDGFSELTDNQIIAPKEPNKKAAPAFEEAKSFLLELLGDGYATCIEVREAAKNANISSGTLSKAKVALNVLIKHYEGDARTLFWWIMPGREVPEYVRQRQATLSNSLSQSNQSEKVDKS